MPCEFYSITTEIKIVLFMLPIVSFIFGFWLSLRLFGLAKSE